MNSSSRFFLRILLSFLAFSSLPVFADMSSECRLEGSYGYLYNGTSQMSAGSLTLTETGVFGLGNGGPDGVGALTFQFANFAGKGPLWLLLREVQSNSIVTPDENTPCTGTIDFLSTATVIKTSNPSLIPEGTVLFTNSPRSIAYTISGLKNEIVDLISTSPGTIASGTAHKQQVAKRGDRGRANDD